MAILVSGMHRSGSSLVASILQSLGVNLGPDEEMVPADASNEAGYFENAPAVAVNDAFLAKNDLSWRILPAIETRTSLVGVDAYVESIGDVAANLDENRPWCLKDPRFSFLLPYWRTAAKPVSAIICLRRPDAVALSLKMRNDLSIGYGAALWELYTVAAMRNTRHMTRAVVVYEELLAKPKQTIEKLIAALPELSQLNPGADAIKAAVERVRRDLDHSKPVNGKDMPPAALDLYTRLASGDLNITKEDAEHGLAFELIRLEAGHQAANRLSNEAREQLTHASEELAAQKAAFARHAERLGDIVGLVAAPGETMPADPEALLEKLRQVVRNMPAPNLKAHTDEAARELLRAKDERIEWLRQELGATGARSQTVLDQSAARENEIARLRAEHEQQALVTAAHQREISRLAGDVQRLHDLLAKAEEDRAGVQRERALAQSEYEVRLAQLATERGMVAETMDGLRARLEEKDALIARLQTERLEGEAMAADLRRIAGERETLLADLARATETLDLRNKELTEIAARERDLTQRAYRLDGEIERLQRDLLQSRVREADLASAATAREQSEGALRAALAQQNAMTTEIQRQLTSARETIESLEKAIAYRTERAEKLEAEQAASQRRLAEYETRTPMLESAAAERAELASRISELKIKIERIIAERDQTLEKNRNTAMGLEKQIAEQTRRLADLDASSRRAVNERNQALAAVAERDTAIRERDAALQTARNRAEQLRPEFGAIPSGLTAGKTAPAADQRLRRQLLVLDELLRAIDTLLSPKYGRFTIPVRQIRVRLTQARQVVDGEVAMTRR